MFPLNVDKAKLKRYFFTGLLVVTPIWGTFLILQTLLAFLDGILGDFFSWLTGWYFPGDGDCDARRGGASCGSADNEYGGSATASAVGSVGQKACPWFMVFTLP